MGDEFPSDGELEPKFRALANPYRRRMLYRLSQNESLTEDDLLSLYENGQDRERCQIDLHHHHLPILSDVGLIRKRPESGGIEKVASFHDVEPLLSLMAENDQRETELPF